MASSPGVSVKFVISKHQSDVKLQLWFEKDGWLMLLLLCEGRMNMKVKTNCLDTCTVVKWAYMQIAFRDLEKKIGVVEFLSIF